MQEDGPPAAELVTLSTSLFACLPHLGAAATMALNLITGPNWGLSSHPAGQAAIRQGSHKWYASQTGSAVGSQRPDAEMYRYVVLCHPHLGMCPLSPRNEGGNSYSPVVLILQPQPPLPMLSLL